MITKEQIRTLDDRALKWYRKHITQFHQECLQFEKCFQGDPEKVFHEHFKELEKLLTEELERRTLEERAEAFGGKLNVNGEYDWGDPVGKEDWG